MALLLVPTRSPLPVPHRADKQDLSGRPSADQRLSPTKRIVGMYDLRRFFISIWKSPVVPIGQRAFQVLGRHEPFSKTSAVDHRKQRLVSETKKTRTTETTETTETKHVNE